jgi:alpha-ribazole phosphatase
MVIYLVRHARPAGADGMCYGRRDIPVAEEETRSVVRSVRALLPRDAMAEASVQSSPLSRCAALAHELVPTRAAVMTPELLELDFGSWEGRAWEDVPRVELDAWARDPWAYAPGGGESARSAFERFQRWALRLRDEGHDTVVAVTHAGVIRLAMAAGSKDPSGLALSIPYGSVHRVLL